MKHLKIKISEAIDFANLTIDAFDTELLMCFVKKVDRSYLYAHRNEFLTKEEKTYFFELVEMRKLKKPLAYLLGKKGFWKNDFYINSSVLVPRPETEILVEKILDYDLTGKELLELGVGSGVISISLGLENHKLSIIGTDSSIDALTVANINSKKLNSENVIFLNHDWNNKWLFPKMDFIVSNPPYVSKSELIGNEDGIWFEPEMALFSDDTGMTDIKTIIFKSINFLKNNGKLLLEHAPNQAKKIVKEAKKAGYTKIEQINDYNGLSRVSILS
ncbi:MAG: peptide chain release factor N(5)-glutamine methyltransferase [Gammaproteobacteria bacterium]